MTVHDIFTIILLSIACYFALILVLACIVFPLIIYAVGGVEEMREAWEFIRIPAQVFGMVWGVTLLILTIIQV